MDLDQTTPTDVQAIKGALRSVQRRQEMEDTTSAFAFEDDEGHLVKVYVPKDKAEDFKEALGAMLDEAEREDLEIAEVIYKLHQSFDIVNVEWCKGAIPEDEEKLADQNDPNAPVQNNDDAEAKGFPQSDPEADVNAAAQGTPDEVSSDVGGQPDMAADMGVDTNAETEKVQLLDKVLSLLQSKTDAERAKADAEKAKADVEASRVAAQAAAHYATSQEEIMDMENFNKRQQENKRESTLQSKLIRYRHDLRKESSDTIEDKINDPDFLLNMLGKAVSGRKLGESMNIAPATPEEEELLAAEDWEEEQRKKKQAEKNREKLMRFRHERSKASQSATEGSDGLAPAGEKTTVEDIKTARFLDFIKASGFQVGADSVRAND